MIAPNNCAEALYELAREEGKTDQIAGELDLIRKCMEEYPEYQGLLDAANIGRNEKIQLLNAAFATAHPYIGNLLKILAEGRKAYLLSACITEYMRIYEQHRGIVKARVILAKPADEGTIEDIRRRLTEASGKMIELQVDTDPDLIGGMILEMEGKCIDNSVRTKLRNMRACVS